MKTTNTIEIGKFISEGRSENSEAPVYVNGKCEGYIVGNRENIGSSMVPRYAITSYDVDVICNNKEIQREFATRGEATAYVRSVFA